MNIVVVKDIAQGIERTKEFLYDEVDRKTVLFLSGGKTPKALYASLAKDSILTPAAVGIIDERYGKPFHENSNERMIDQSGLLTYLEQQNIPFFSMLQHHGVTGAASFAKASSAKGDLPNEASARLDGDRQGLTAFAQMYDQTVRDLFFKFPKSIGIMGIGNDGHIASIFPNIRGFTNPLFAASPTYEYVTSVEHPGGYGKRISLTFAGLSLIDFFVVFVFGKEKKKALKKAMEQGPVEEIPARFFQRPEISEKTLIITDQKL